MRYTIRHGKEDRLVQIRALKEGGFEVQIDDGPVRRVRAARSGARTHLIEGLKSHLIESGAHAEGRHFTRGGVGAVLEVYDDAALRRQRLRGGASGGDEVIASPMPGRVVKILVAVGDAVTEGQPVAIVEAMKMENELRAQIDGKVASVHAAEGDQVEGKAPLVVLDPA